MLVPEAPMHHYYSLVAWQYYVGLARKIPAVQPKTVAHCMKETADAELRFGVFLAHAAHDA